MSFSATPIADAYIYAYTVLALYHFRDCLKKGVIWGAFEIAPAEPRLAKTKFVLSVILLIVVPLAFFVLFWSAVEGWSTSVADPLESPGQIFLYFLCLFFFGVFPKGTKHAWLLCAKHMTRKGTETGQQGEGWLSSDFVKMDNLPKDRYSYQTVGLTGVWPLLIVLFYRNELLFPDFEELWKTLYVGLVVAQFIVSREGWKKWNYFHSEEFPRNLPSWRMVFITFPLAVVMPTVVCTIGFGWLLLAFSNGASWLPLVYSVLSLPTPFLWTQGLLVLAFWRRWTEDEEVREGAQRQLKVWWGFLITAATCSVIVIVASIYNITTFSDLF